MRERFQIVQAVFGDEDEGACEVSAIPVQKQPRKLAERIKSLMHPPRAHAAFHRVTHRAGSKGCRKLKVLLFKNERNHHVKRFDIIKLNNKQ